MYKHMKKFLALVMALAMLATAAVPVFAKGKAQQDLEIGLRSVAKSTSDKFKFQYQPAKGYWSQHLSKDAQTAYNLIKKGIENHETKIDIPDISDSERKNMVNYVQWENPELFYFDISSDFDRIKQEWGVYYTFKPEYDKNYKQEIIAVNNVIKKIVSGAPKNGSDYEKELYVHDYLIDHCVYDKGQKNIYNSLVEGKGNCMGYAYAMQMILEELGVTCRIMFGSTPTDAKHMWNIVTINGKEYCVDTAWDDDGGNRVRYAYFNVPKSEISRDHKAKNEHEWDKCTSTDLDWYKNHNLYFNSYEELEAHFPEIIEKKQYSFKMKNQEDALAAFQKISDGKTNPLHYQGSIGRKGPLNGAITIILK